VKRALLLFNPEATSVSARVRDVIAHALQSEVALETAETKRRHHATHLAEGAAHEGFDLIVCLGGDGTLNEVIQGIAGTPMPVVPLPGGGTNVFARTLGLPRDPVEATAVILDRLHDDDAPRRINLGRVNGRVFASNAGVGFDAAIVKAVERRFRLKRRMGEPVFVYQGVRLFFFAYPRRTGQLTLVAGDHAYEGLHATIACNGDPYTFLGERPFRLCPQASHERGLDVTGLASFRTVTALRIIARAFGSGGHTKMRSVHALHDLGAFTVRSASPAYYQVDGDYAGEDTTFAFESMPDALSVIA
jgi:diacylglycerol kinase family enzyme